MIATDPVKAIVDMFIIPSRHINTKPTFQDGLVRAKAMSLYTLYNNCPMIGPLCWAVLKKTRGKEAIFDDEDVYKREETRKVLQKYKEERDFFKTEPEIDEETRVFFSNRYGWDVSYQQAYEEQISLWADDKEAVLPTHPLLDIYFSYGATMLKSTQRESVNHRSASLAYTLYEKYCQGHEAGLKWMNVGTGEMSESIDKNMAKRKSRENMKRWMLCDLQTGPTMFVNA